MRTLKILIVDDESDIISLLEQNLEILGYATEGATNGKEALKKIYTQRSGQGFPGILVTDIQMAPMDGLELMKRTLELDPDLPVILVTAYGNIPKAVQAMRDGAYDFIEKPIDCERLAEVVKRAMEKRSLILQNRSLSLVIKSGMAARIIGNAPLIDELRKDIVTLADIEASVLILGETGTGKELVAQCLHDFSSRRKHKFVPINCGAIPETLIENELFGNVPGAFAGATGHMGKLEYAHGGTVFFDEIESMPINLQPKLLRALQEHKIVRLGSNKEIPVDFRVVTATKVDLKTEVESGRFREDLYYRLNVFPISIPPLRERREDIPLLFNHFVAKNADRYKCDLPQFSSSDLSELMAYSWTGNVRELNNIAERYIIINLKEHKGPIPISQLIHSSAKYHSTLPEQVEAFERGLIVERLKNNKGNIGASAEDLGLPRRTLNEKMRKHNLKREDFLD